MNQIKETKEDIISYKEELECLLATAARNGSLDFITFLRENLQIINHYLNNIEAGDYTPFVKLAYENPIIFQYLAVQRKNLQDLLPRYETLEEELNASVKEKERADEIYLRISAINRELNELSEPLKDNALEILIMAFKAVQDYKTNNVGIEVVEGSSSNKVYMHLEGFKEAYLSFHHSGDFPQLHATDENGNNIYMKCTDDFNCEISNANSIENHTTGYLGSHLWNPGGYEKISQILDNLRNAINNFAIQRKPEMANEKPLTFEQLAIAKADIFRSYPLSSYDLSESEKSFVYRKKW